MSNVLKSKYLLGVIVLAAVAVLFAMFATTALAYTHTVTLKQGSSGSQVMSLQQALGITADGKFGPMTKASVMAFQSSHGLVADGVVGPMTGAALAGGSMGTFPAGCSSSSGFSTTTGMSCSSSSSSLPSGCTSTAGYSPTTGVKCSTTGSTGSSGPLSGGAGSITVRSLSDFSGETVGENQNDVEVLAFEVEADDESDVELTSVKVEFVQATAGDSKDLEDYADSVSVWFGGEKVGDADAQDFSENSNVWTKTIALDGAIVRSGDKEKVVIAVSAANNLDSGDINDDAWTADVLNVRFVDADGVTTTEDTDSDTLEKAFDFDSAASAGDTELKITNGEDQDEVNDAHVIDIHATDETQNVPLLSFNLELEGDLDVTIDQLPIRFTVATQDNVDEMINGISLWMDGDKISEVDMATDCVEDGAGCADVGTQETYFFDDMNLDLGAGDDHEFLVKVDFFGDTDTPGDLAPGDTIKAEFGEIQTDLSQFDVQDETGEDLADGDKTGTVTGSYSEVRDVGISVSLVSATAAKTAGNAQATQSDSGLFTITYDVTAFGGNVYMDATPPDATGSASGVGTETDLATTPAAGLGGTLNCTLTSPSGATLSGTAGVDARFLVEEDETERFAITCDVRDGAVDLADAFFDVAVTEILYALTDVDGDLGYTFNLEDFKTPQIFLDDNGA